MSTAISLEIEGIEEVQELLGRNWKTPIQTAIKKTIFTLERVAVQNTPVVTGTLRRSYQHEFGDMEAEFGNYREYATSVEYTSRRNKGYFRKSVKEVDGKVQGIFEKEIELLIK